MNTCNYFSEPALNWVKAIKLTLSRLQCACRRINTNELHGAKSFLKRFKSFSHSRLLLKPTVHYRVRESPRLAPILNRIHQMHAKHHIFFMLHFIIVMCLAVTRHRQISSVAHVSADTRLVADSRFRGNESIIAFQHGHLVIWTHGLNIL
jgi:hypothetical protein